MRTAKFIASLVEVETDDCVLWPFATNGDGYGIVGWRAAASRLVTHHVLRANGQPRPPAPNNLALHSCDTPACVNPRHLRWGSTKDNVRDKVVRGRASGGSMLGESNPCAKLSVDDVVAIRRKARMGATKAALAREFAVSESLIRQVIRRQVWKHVDAVMALLPTDDKPTP